MVFHRSVLLDRSAAGIIVLAQKVHSLAQLVQEDERADEAQAAQNIPAPERAGSEPVSNTTAAELVIYTVAEPVMPYKSGDA